MAKYLQSVSNGGTGVRGDIIKTSDIIRSRGIYGQWVKKCLARANNKCEISGNSDCVLNVHHIVPLHKLIIDYNITKDNYMEYADILLDVANGMVLCYDLHHQLHKQYGVCPSFKDILALKHSFYTLTKV